MLAENNLTLNIYSLLINLDVDEKNLTLNIYSLLINPNVGRKQSYFKHIFSVDKS